MSDPTPAIWRSRIVGHGRVDPRSLMAHPLNWRVHPKNQRSALGGAIEDIGFWRSVSVNKRSGTVVDGHLRVAYAIEQEQPLIDVEWVDLGPEEEAKALASADSIAGLAAVERTKLDELLRQVKTAAPDFQTFLATFARKNGLYLDMLRDRREAPEPKLELAETLKLKWGTQPGQTWIIPSMSLLGEAHRLVIGDSTDAAAVKVATDGTLVDLIFTDPPYGVNYVGKTADAMKIANDNLSDAGTRMLVRDAANAWPLKPGGVWYVCSPAGDMETAFRLALIEAKQRLRQQLVWVKSHFVFGHSDYHWRHETILYGWAEGAAHYFAGPQIYDTVLLDEESMNSRMTKKELLAYIKTIHRLLHDSVWKEERPAASRLHPTTKPVELARKAMQNSSKRGWRVWDGFVGSGTTMVAAELEGRLCYAMDNEAKYAAVALERMSDLGCTPMLEATEEAAA